MAIPSWASQAVVRIRPGSKTSRGSAVPDWDNVQTLTIQNCSVQPASATLSQDGRIQGVSEGLTIYLPPESDVLAGDRIQYDGNVYTITGEPKKWVSPTGRVSNMQLNVMRYYG